MHGHEGATGFGGNPAPFRADINNPLVPNQLGKEVMRVVENFNLGVEFFFLISGFLITYLMLTEINKTGKLHIGKFYVRRALRIWPLYFLVLFSAPLWATLSKVSEPNYLMDSLFLGNYVTIYTQKMEAGLAHLWSICVEEHFYIFWPLLIAFVPVKRMPWLFGAVILVAIGFRFYAYAHVEHAYIHGRMNILSRMDTLAIGAWIAWYYHKKPFEFRVPRLVRLLVYAGLAFLILYDNVNFFGGQLSFVFKRLLYTAFFAFILVNYLFNPDAFFNFKKKNILHYFGKISYGIYLWHNVLIGLIFETIIYKYNLAGVYKFWPIYLGITFAISILSYELIEKQFLRLKDRFAIVATRR